MENIQERHAPKRRQNRKTQTNFCDGKIPKKKKKTLKRREKPLAAVIHSNSNLKTNASIGFQQVLEDFMLL
jgi:hypothetical protein